MARKSPGELLMRTADRHPYVYVALCYFVVVILALFVSDTLIVPGTMRFIQSRIGNGDSVFYGFELLVAWCLYGIVIFVLSMVAILVTVKNWIVVVKARHVLVSVLPGVLPAIYVFRRYLAGSVNDTYFKSGSLTAALLMAVAASLGGIVVCNMDPD